ncbi:hypothetical protein CLAIMM_07170 [Cladophialophora immunda]|nr:hypothetical protein CLAIMM_07170 [Cladophialophora immunda]
MSEAGVADSVQARRQRRRAAGQSGGEFEIVRHNGTISYRYVWPDKEKDFVDRLVSWAVAGPTTASVVTESDKTPDHNAQVETKKDNPNEENIVLNVQDTETKAVSDDVGCVEMITSGQEVRKARGAFRRLNRRISGWLQCKKADGKEDELEESSGLAPEQGQPWISQPQLPPVHTESPVKEQLEFEADRVSTHEDVNWGFFLAQHGSSDLARQFENEIRCSNVIDDQNLSDGEKD